jgi:hypothetical protein
MSALSELRERVERASGADPEMDIDIWCEIFAPDAIAVDFGFRAPPYAASIDAALALVERRLGVYSIKVTIDPSGEGADLTWWPEGLSGERELHFKAVSNSACLAILTALLRALESQEQDGG